MPERRAASAARRKASSRTSGRPPAGPPPRTGARWWPWALAALFAFALAWRVAYLLRLGATPFAGDLSADARVYWDWSERIARQGPIGTWPFFLGPLYPHVLAAVRAVPGDGIPRVLFLQAVLDSLSVVLLADAARRASRPVVAAGVGVLLALYAHAVFFSGLVLAETLLFLLQALLIRTVMVAGPRWTAARAAGAGALIGLLALGRGTNLLLLVPALLAVGGGAPDGIRRSAVTLAAAVAMLLPAIAHNRVVSGEWMGVTYSAGLNLHIGNHERASGGWAPVIAPPKLDVPAENEAGRPLDGRADLLALTGRHWGAGESSRYWSAKVREFVTRNPARAAGLVLRRIGMLWNRREYPQVENADVYRRVAGPLGLPFGFAPFGALALAGAFLVGVRDARGRFLIASLAVLTLGTAAFFVTDRFRIHLVPAASVLGAMAVDRVLGALATRDAAALLRAGLGVLLGCVVLALPAPDFGEARRRWGIAAEIGDRWMRIDRMERALPYLEEAARFERLDAARRRSLAATLDERAELHLQLGVALLAAGRVVEGREWLERARQERPGDPRIVRALAAGRGTPAPP